MTKYTLEELIIIAQSINYINGIVTVHNLILLKWFINNRYKFII